ncbi:MAG: porin family protein [Gemmatimonadota bacterium]|uniref:porin family protein n=1 Tax=Candidatus Palauibacter scopulicola TaxID=3056741 RepID=UPI0023A3A330|nr:porin family protein [Candidatus Palauibacter scopulicola]MDE2663365.1 porin family protein [Candidatus Palauibacter scopulicola]
MSTLTKSFTVTLLASLLTSLAAVPLAAQTTIGLRGGIGTATLSRDAPQVERGELNRSRFGAVSGIDVGIPLSGTLDLRVGMGLAQKGGGTDTPPSVTSSRAFVVATAELDYLQFSALFRASADAERGLLKVGVLAGPYVALNHSCDIAVTTRHSPPGSGQQQPSSKSPPWRTEASCLKEDGADFRSTDLGLAFGAGVEVRLGASLGLALDVIYAMGLSRIDDDGTRNRHLALQSGIVFVVG